MGLDLTRLQSLVVVWWGQSCVTVKRLGQYSVYEAMAFTNTWFQMPKKQDRQKAPGSLPTSATYEYELLTPDLSFQPKPLSY